jgi:hypothetical protein
LHVRAPRIFHVRVPQAINAAIGPIPTHFAHSTCLKLISRSGDKSSGPVLEHFPTSQRESLSPGKPIKKLADWE